MTVRPPEGCPAGGAETSRPARTPLRVVARRIIEQVRGVNPFGGEYRPSRVPLVAFGRPSLPIPHPWNYRTPLRIFAAYYWGADRETGAGRHNRYLYVGGRAPILVTRDPAVIKAILLATGDRPDQFERDSAPSDGIARETGSDSLLYANGALWRAQKQLAAKPFSRTTLFHPEEFGEFERTFRATVVARLAALRARQAETGQAVTRVQLEPEIQPVMLEMLINSFFGAQIPYETLRERYVPALDSLIRHMITITVAPRLSAVAGLFTGEWVRLARWRGDFERLTDLALAGRPAGKGLWGQFKSDANDAALRSNIRVFLAGALEATTSFAAWAISHLSRRPDLQEIIAEEIKDIDEYTPDALASARTLNAVLEETLRLTPSLYFLPRRAPVELRVEIAGKGTMVIPAGTHIGLDVWHSNRCEEFWGEAVTGYPAAEFRPERWAQTGKPAGEARDLPHFGFGSGARVCPGKFLGVLEAGLVVAGIVKLFKFRAVNERTGATVGVSTKPDDGVLVDLQLR